MDSRKLLLVDTSPSFCAALAETLGGAYDLRVCNDGLQALALLDSFRPDILVTDLALPGLDGVALLKTATACPKRPVLLVTTRFCSTYIENVIGELGVDYMMLKPCDIRALADRIYDLSVCESTVVPGPCPRTAVSNMLLALGVPVGRKGHGYLEEIIELYCQDPCRSLTKDLYPAVGRGSRTNGVSVERAIRGVIQTAWEQRDEAVWRRYFTPCRGGMVPRPTNRAFIAALAEVLGRQEQRQA